MRDDKQDLFLDELLEAALKQYRGEEPRPGLEMRILAGIRSGERAARRRGLAWAVAACAGMLAIIGLTLHFAHAPSRKTVTSASGAPRAPLQAAKPLASSGSADSRLGSPRLVHEPNEKPRTPKSPCGPKPSGLRPPKAFGPHAGGGPGVRATKRPEQFPTPLPLTEQEKLLLAYVAKAPKPELVAGTNEKDDAAVSDLEIPGIKIAALEIKPLDDSQSEQEK